MSCAMGCGGWSWACYHALRRPFDFARHTRLTGTCKRCQGRRFEQWCTHLSDALRVHMALESVQQSPISRAKAARS